MKAAKLLLNTLVYTVEKLSRNDEWPQMSAEHYKSAEVVVLTT